MIRFGWICLFLLMVLTFSCLKDKTTPYTSGIKLKWNAPYPEAELNDALVGLEWAFSHIGARYTQQIYGIEQVNGTIYVELSKLGFPQHTLTALKKLNQALFLSEEYQTHQSIDMGRYVTLLIGASEHYFTFVDMPDNLEGLIGQYPNFIDSGYVNNSFITTQDRVVKFSDQNDLRQLFIAEEHDPESGNLLGVETVDIMENGQLRFGIFDAHGNRKESANPDFTEAGKPGKCMWCHESAIQPLFHLQDDTEGYLSHEEFRDTLIFYQAKLKAEQGTLVQGVNYANLGEHVSMELLYISFMEPSAQRLANEWEMSITEVEDLLAGIPTHEHEEFPFLGRLYFREDVEEFAPFGSLQVSSSVREKSAVEVNYLKE